jgi:limonene-1,2-epoxide hydrolase
MGTNGDLAIRLFEHWPELGAHEIAALFTDDAVYRNIPFPGDNIGGEAVAAVLGSPALRERIAAIEPRIISAVEQGDLVMVERVERFIPKQGEPFELPVVGVVEVRDGKIAAWRDYFDAGQWKLPPS